MKRLLPLLAIVLLGARNRIVIPETQGRWLREHAIADVAAFARDAQVVALGDVTHGTRELFVARARMIRDLVEHGGFDTIAIELPYGEITPETLRSEDYWFWNTREVRDLVLWAHDANVPVVGIEATRPLEVLDRFLASVPPSVRAEADQRSACMRVPKYVRSAACLESVLSLRELVSGDELLHLARVVEQGEETLASKFTNRDAVMAENVLWLAGRGRVVVWGHNEHFGRIPYAVFDPDAIVSAGTTLSATLGDRYVVIGSVVEEGTFNALDFDDGIAKARPQQMPPPSPDDYALVFGQANADEIIIPMHPTPPWLATPRRIRVAASSVLSRDDTMWQPVEDLAAKFDAVHYLRRSTPSELLP